jgi:hypothetical protein
MGAVGDLLFCKCASIVVWWVLRTIARHFPSPTFPSCPVHLKASCWIRALLFVSITTYCVSFLVDACHLHKDRHWISCYPRVITSSGSFCLVVSGCLVYRLEKSAEIVETSNIHWIHLEIRHFSTSTAVYRIMLVSTNEFYRLSDFHDSQ